MRLVSTENARDIKSGAKEKSGFSGAVRPLELNAINDNDVITIPQPGYTVLERPIRGTENTYEYVNVDVERNGSQTVAPFTPTLFWRRYAEVDANGTMTGNWIVADGNVVQDVQNYATVDDFFTANAGRKFRVNFGPAFMASGFGEGSKPVQRRKPTLTWVD